MHDLVTALWQRRIYWHRMAGGVPGKWNALVASSESQELRFRKCINRYHGVQSSDQRLAEAHRSRRPELGDVGGIIV